MTTHEGKQKGEWKFLCKASEFNFKKYHDRLNKRAAITITKTNMEDFIDFDVKEKQHPDLYIPRGKGTQPHNDPALQGHLEIKQIEDEIHLRYDIWVKKSVSFSFPQTLLIGLILGSVSFGLMLFLKYDFTLSAGFGLAIFCVLLLMYFSIRTTEIFDPETQRDRIDYYFYEKDKGWLE